MKIMTRLTVFFFMMMVSAHTHAQQWSLGVRGGLSIPNLSAGGSSSSNPLNTGYKSRLGPDLGVFAECKVSQVFSIQPMIEYSSQGGKKDGLQGFPVGAFAQEFPQGMAPTYLYANFKSEAKLNYLMIPILAKFGWDFNAGSPFRFYVDAGPFVGFNVAAKQVTTGSSNIYLDAAGTQPLPTGTVSFDTTQDIKSQINTVNFGLEANAGFTYKFSHSNLFIEGGFNYGFLNIQKGTANGKNNTGAGTVSVGYQQWFGGGSKKIKKA